MRKTSLLVVVTGWSVILAFCPAGAAQSRSDANHPAMGTAGTQITGRSGLDARAPRPAQPVGSANPQPVSAAAWAVPATKQSSARVASRQPKARSDAVEARAKNTPPDSSQKKGVVLVPPPPPAIPSSGQLTFLSGTPVEFLSESDLKRHKEQLDVNLSRARRQACEQERLLKEKVQRAELFASLYKEGVVSRRELENSQKEVGRSEGDLTDARLKVTDLERDMQRIDERLKQLSVGQAARKQVNRGKK